MTITSSGEYAVTMWDQLIAASTVPLDRNRSDTPEAALITMGSAVASSVSQGAQLARDATNAESATGDALSGIAAGQGLTRRPATQSRYTVRTVDGPATLDGDEIARGGGASGDAQWTILTTGVVTAGSDVVIEAVDTGAITLSSPTTLDLVTTTPGLTQLVWDAGTDPAGQIGRARETNAELRVRIARGGQGLLAALYDLDWVVAADAPTTAPGEVTVTVAPGPVGSDQIAELVDTIGPRVLGIATAGAESGTYTQPNGSTETIRWDEGATDSIPVTVTVVGVTTGVEDAIRAYFTTLDRGAEVVRQRVIAAALTVSGVTDVTACTLNGVSANYTPALTDFPAASTITVST